MYTGSSVIVIQPDIVCLTLSPYPPSSLTHVHRCIGYRNPTWHSIPRYTRLIHLSVYDNNVTSPRSTYCVRVFNFLKFYLFSFHNTDNLYLLLSWEPWYQGDRVPQTCNPGSRAFFFREFFFGEIFLDSVFLSFPLSLSFPLYTQFGYFWL